MEEQAFNITDPIAVDLTDVVEQRLLAPASSNVKVRINKASSQTNKDGDIKSLKLEVRIIEGIPVNNPETGETELKYQNKPLFTNMMDLCYWADSESRNSNWFKTKQHLVEFKKFCKALDLPMQIQVNDEFLMGLINRELLVDIQHEKETMIDPDTGERKETGGFRERLRNWKKVSS